MITRISSLITLLLIPITASAQFSTERLTNIPFVNGTDLGSLVAGLFYLAIVVAGMLAVVKLVIAGAKYMMSDVVTTKQSAISDIKGALIGLLLVMGTVVILDTINDQIANANLDSIRPLNLPEWSGGGGGLEVAPPITDGNPIDLTGMSSEMVDTYGAACVADGAHSFTISNNDDGTVTGVCEETHGSTAPTAELSTPTEVSEFAAECASNNQDFIQTPLPNGNTLGRCVSCTGGDIYNETSESCQSLPLTCDDGSPIENCRGPVTFDESGNPTIEGASSGDEVQFDCSYEDSSVSLACGEWCMENGGDVAATRMYCSGAIIP